MVQTVVEQLEAGYVQSEADMCSGGQLATMKLIVIILKLSLDI